jgi:hypothetical protein
MRCSQLESVANNWESEARHHDPRRFDDDPGLLKHKVGDEDIRTFVIATCGIARLLFGHDLYGTIATISNVVFRPNVKIEAARVREMLRSPKDK